MTIELYEPISRAGLTELATADPELWAKESFDIVTKIAPERRVSRNSEGETKGLP
jgi:hypothetical protein